MVPSQPIKVEPEKAIERMPCSIVILVYHTCSSTASRTLTCNEATSGTSWSSAAKSSMVPKTASVRPETRCTREAAQSPTDESP